jgi:putative serine protease PepD
MKKLVEIFLLIIVVFLAIYGIGSIIERETEQGPYIHPIRPPEMKLEDVVEDVIGSVVHIANEDGGWQGSGVVISSYHILTARHVAEKSDNFTITLNNGNRWIKSTRAISSKEHDIALIKVTKPMKIKPVKLGSIKETRLGQQVFAIGSPYGKINFNSVTLGIISGFDRDWDETNPYTGESYGWKVAFTTDAAGHPGNSGCPVFSMDGKVRGILVGGHSPVLIGCMPVDLVLDDIEQIKRMFIEDEYYIEEEPEYDEYGPPYYGDE